MGFGDRVHNFEAAGVEIFERVVGGDDGVGGGAGERGERVDVGVRREGEG